MTTEQEKVFRIRPLDEKSDYSLWRLRVRAAISSKGLKHVLTPIGSDETSTHVDASSSTAATTATVTEMDSSSAIKATLSKTATDDQKEQASNIIISALGDHALRVVRTVIDDPYQMMKKLDARYDSKSTATRISKIVELMSTKFTSVDDDIGKNIDNWLDSRSNSKEWVPSSTKR